MTTEEHIRRQRSQALLDAAAEIQQWRDEGEDEISFWTSRDWRDWLVSRARKEEEG